MVELEREIKNKESTRTEADANIKRVGKCREGGGVRGINFYSLSLLFSPKTE